jgi:hypothetical protein
MKVNGVITIKNTLLVTSGFYEDFQDWTFVSSENKGIIMVLSNTGKKDEAKYIPNAIAKLKETITYAAYDASLDLYIIGYITGIIEVYKLINAKNDDGTTKQEFKFVHS